MSLLWWHTSRSLSELLICYFQESIMGGYQRNECFENIKQNQQKLSTMDLKSWSYCILELQLLELPKSGANDFSKTETILWGYFFHFGSRSIRGFCFIFITLRKLPRNNLVFRSTCVNAISLEWNFCTWQSLNYYIFV